MANVDFAYWSFVCTWSSDVTPWLQSHTWLESFVSGTMFEQITTPARERYLRSNQLYCRNFVTYEYARRTHFEKSCATHYSAREATVRSSGYILIRSIVRASTHLIARSIARNLTGSNFGRSLGRSLGRAFAPSMLQSLTQ